MSDRGTPHAQSADRYGGVARFFHWSIAALIVLQFVLAQLGDLAEEDGERLRQLALLANHKSVGMTVLLLATLRIAWRFVSTPPSLPSAMPAWQRTVSFCSHGSLYVLLFALPITGWLMSSASAYSVSWFGLFTWPDLVEPSKPLLDVLRSTHGILAKLLFVVALIHIGAALKHHLVDRDDVLKRMSSTLSYALSLGIVVIGTWSLTDVGRSAAGIDDAGGIVLAADTAATGDASNQSSGSAASGGETVTTPAANPWAVDYEASYIEFTAEQAGAPFTGRWTRWTADMRFSDDALDTSVFDVRIRVDGVSTDDEERDSTLQDPEFFDAESWPVVRFRTGPIRKDGDAYVSDSSLSVKGRETPVTFRFEIAEDGRRRELTGSARLDRLALDVGTGEWSDTSWIGQYVDVEVLVVAEVGRD